MRSVMFAILVLMPLSACGKAKEADKADAPAPQESAAPAAKKAETGAVDTAQAGTPAPTQAFAREDGSKVTLADFRGKPVLVNLWATWCAPCVAEMPALDRLAKAKAGEMAVIGISQDLQGWDKVKPFLAKTNLQHMTILLDEEGALATTLGAPGLPFTVLYDAAGKEVWRVNGPREWDQPGGLPAIPAAETATRFRAIGQEPGWTFTLETGGTIAVSADYGEKTATFKAPARLPLTDGSFSAAEGEHALAVSIAKTACADTMSGKAFDYTVSMELDGKRYEGCGEVL
ncbi:redoxin family protein [Sphingosinicella soli]|uniref:Thiol-disulfide isomerase/thioredoxin n=1 Tax=Sphingosinicella soli TaxID=333708 RepID=A0A7W7B0D7_9SPHN|nr:redoxin family protein [Sphingosinicella soli]MBB4631736.1 thiol-disulfide isomerase/thioredoxin [Sphingosinicella soli]